MLQQSRRAQSLGVACPGLEGFVRGALAIRYGELLFGFFGFVVLIGPRRDARG